MEAWIGTKTANKCTKDRKSEFQICNALHKRGKNHLSSTDRPFLGAFWG